MWSHTVVILILPNNLTAINNLQQQPAIGVCLQLDLTLLATMFQAPVTK
jgi:hypothetical protein